MLKINGEIRSRGLVYFDVTKLKSVARIRKLDNVREEF